MEDNQERLFFFFCPPVATTFVETVTLFNNKAAIGKMKEGGDCTDSSTATMTSSGALRETTKIELRHLRHLEDSGLSETGPVPLTDDRPHSVFHDHEKESDEEEFVDSSSEDENADLESTQYFNQQKAQSSNRSLRRVDSLKRFTTHSLRLSILGKDKPPPAEEAAKRKVRFRPDEDLESVFELPEVPEDEIGNAHMTHADFERNEADVKLTQFRWENHLNGKIRFDETEGTVRGIEFMNRPEQLIKERQILQHRQEVLEVSLMQKTANLFQDHPLNRAPHQWETLRKASLEISHLSLSEAQARGRQDHIDYCMAWGESHDSVQHETSLDNTFGINAAAAAASAALLRGKHEQPKQRQRESHSIKPQQQAQDKTKKKNPLLFWKKK
jgi:hypothetical protein